jgi:hypothetical protein
MLQITQKSGKDPSKAAIFLIRTIIDSLYTGKWFHSRYVSFTDITTMQVLCQKKISNLLLLKSVWSWELSPLTEEQ